MKSFVPAAIRHCVLFLRYYGIRKTLGNTYPYLREFILGTEQRAEREDSFDAEFRTDTARAVWP